MVKTFCLASLAFALAVPAFANDFIEYPLNTPDYPFKRSCLTRQATVIPPYDHVFPIRVYTTPPQQPYYNVPPYRVISPY